MVDKWTAGRFDHYRSRIKELETQNAQLIAQLEAAQKAMRLFCAECRGDTGEDCSSLRGGDCPLRTPTEGE